MLLMCFNPSPVDEAGSCVSGDRSFLFLPGFAACSSCGTPAYPNDPISGNPKNRRVDIYVRPVDHPVSDRVLPMIGKDAVMPALAEDPE